MSKNWYRETIEALGMQAAKNRIINKLNAVHAYSEDASLRGMTARLISELNSASSNTQAFSPIQMRNGVPSAKSVLEYCEARAYSTT